MNSTDQLTQYIEDLDGYKIQDTHFRIGSKYHSTSFFYAKRLFLNSYYTSRIALLIAKKIHTHVSDVHTKLTLIGYEMYSELLLSLIIKFLQDMHYEKVNHFIMVDANDCMRRIPEIKESIENYIIIVPIVSTGSTSVKISNEVKKLGISSDPLQYYHVICARDPKEEAVLESGTVETILQIKTQWHDPESCPLCFDDNCSKPLLETDKTDLTPTLIYDLPITKQLQNIDDDDNPGQKEEEKKDKIGKTGKVGMNFSDVIFDDSLLYKSVIRNDEYYIYSTDTEIFIEKNKDSIIEWLKKVKEDFNIDIASKIIIISPCHYSNTSFINMVNEILFNSSATIIYHQSDADYAENFKSLNHKYLNEDKKSGLQIYYVDDALISGKNFFKIYDLFRYTVNYSITEAMTGAIFLTNKSSADINTRVCRAAKKAHFFVAINMPLQHKVSNKNPLEHEKARYEALSGNTLHDDLRMAYSLKARELRDFNKKDTHAVRHLEMFKTIHKVYDYLGKLSKSTELKNLSFEEFLTACRNKDGAKLDKFVTMKILCQHPFILYLPVLHKTFEWHKQWLDETFFRLQESTKANSIGYEDFTELKFLIRRAVFLRNYRILTEDFFLLLSKIFSIIDSKNPSGSDNMTSNEYGSQKENIQDFYKYLACQYIEMIHMNGWCAKKLSDILKNVRFQTEQGKRFHRMLNNELAAVLAVFYDMLITEYHDKWINLYKPQEKETASPCTTIDDPENKNISDFLHQAQIESKNKFRIADQAMVLQTDNQYNPQFLNFLWIKLFLHNDNRSRIAGDELTYKTKILFDKLKGLFIHSHKIGAFFIIIDGRGQPHLVYDKDMYGYSLLKNISGNHWNFFARFLHKGNGDNKTVFEYLCKDEALWENLYNPEAAVPFIKNENCKWILMNRIGDKKQNSPIGLIGFYGQENRHDDILSKQLLMLLRDDLEHYVNHHHRNDEFAHLIIADATRRFAYLAGHGRQVMQSLANIDHEVFYPVVKTMEQLQFLFATKLLSSRNIYLRNEKNKADSDMLFHIFHCEPISKKILSQTMNRTLTMAQKIYEEEIVEVPQDVEITHDIQAPDESHFCFNSKLIEFICFELLINAKKNRFHFAKDIFYNTYKIKEEKNRLHIQFDLKATTLLIGIMGTGPSVSETIKRDIREGNQIKIYDEIAGLNLITKLIQIFNPGNRLYMESRKSPSAECIYENTLYVELKSENQKP